MQRAIENQPWDLSTYCTKLQRLRNEYAILKPSRTIFTGSGDSYSAALFASELTNGISQAFDPYELSKKAWLARGKHIVIISVSGKTKTNIDLATKLRRKARAVVAVTSDLDSPLALKCDDTILLNHRRENVPTAGTSSYTSSLLACGFLLGKLPKTVDVSRRLARAWVWAEKTAGHPIPTSPTVIGSELDHAVGHYGALKFNEVLGLPATCQYPEEFGHAYLFSIKKTDTLVCLNSDHDQKTHAVFKAMRRSDFTTLSVQSQERDAVLRGIEIAFHFQCLAYMLARRKGLKECSFISDRRRLGISSRLIY